MESINNFQRITQDDIASLQDRMIQVEEAIESIQKDVSESQHSQSPYPYGYMQPGQPMYYGPAPGMIPGYYPYPHQPMAQRTPSDSTLKQGKETSARQTSQKNEEDKYLAAQGLRQGVLKDTQKQPSQSNLQGGPKKNESEPIPRRLEPTLLESRDNSESPLRAKGKEEHEKSGLNDTGNISLNQTITWERIDNFLAVT